MSPATPPERLGGNLWHTFLAAMRKVDPTLPADALAVLLPQPPRPGQRPQLSPVNNDHEALRWIWEEDINLEGPAVRMYLEGLPGAASPIPRDRLILEVRIRGVLTAVANEVRSGRKKFTATNPQSHQSFEPDPALLEELRGSDRSRNQIPTERGFIRSLHLIDVGPSRQKRQERPAPTRERWITTIERDLAAGEFTLDELASIKEASLGALYPKAKRDTLRKARKIVLTRHSTGRSA